MLMTIHAEAYSTPIEYSARLKGMTMPEFVASYVCLHGASFTEPARNTFAQRARAARAAGFVGIGSHLVDTFEFEGGAEAVAQTAREVGISLVETEFLPGWALADNVDQPTELELRVAALGDAAGIHHVTAGDFAPGPLDVGRAAANLATLAARPEPHCVTLAIEPFAYAAIKNYDIALDIVRRSGARNVGIMLDAWQVFNTGAEISFLNDVDLSEIAAMQLDDGPRVFDDFQALSRTTRFLPGDGDLDVLGLARKLIDMGFDGPWSVEVHYPELREMPVEEAAQLVFDSSLALVQAAAGA
jgi:sugar phosphate isomerase/epimerase